MITRTSRGMKRLAATAAAVAVIGSSLAITGSALAGPGAAAPTAVTYAGADRYATATAVADALPSISTITVANGLNFPDGLTGALLDQAIILTEVDSIPAPTKNWLIAKNASINNIQIVGGVDVVSAAVATELGTYGTVTRIAGPTRYTTATAVAEAGSPTATTIIVATGLDFPDALASGPLAIELDAPIILNAGPALRDDVKAYLSANAQITKAYIVGEVAAVPATVATELTARGYTVERLGGSNRDATAVAIANELKTLGTADGYDDGAIIANRLRFPDAMVAGPLGANRNFPIVLVARDSVPAATGTYLRANCSTIATIVAVGGPAVISASTTAAAQAAATCGTAASNQTFTVAGATEGRNLGADGARTCLVTVPAGTTVTAALFPSEDVRVAAGGVTFSDALGGANQADNEGAVVATVGIANVNGTPTVGSPGEVNGIVSGGTISVTLSAGATDDVTLVVFQDQPGFTANTLDLAVPAVANTNPKAPRENFGVGCRTLFANEASGGTFGAIPVASTDKAANLFTAGVNNFFYDANDIFQIGGVPQPAGQAGLDAFEARLSPSDDVAGTYAPDPAGVSTFNLTDSDPVAPATATATASATTVTLTYAESTTVTADSYNIYRAIRPASALSCPNFNTAGSTGRGLYPATPTATQPDPTPSTAGATSRTFTDAALAPNTTYCYAVTTVDEGDESNTGTVANDVTTSIAGSAPLINDVRARDAGLIGVVDAGDIHQFIFNEPMNASVAATGLYRVQDADGTVADINCATVAGACVLQPAGTYNGTAYPANQVLRVTLAATNVVPVGSPFLGTVAGIQYPVTITNVNDAFDDAGGTQLDLAGSPDKVIEVAAITPAVGADLTAPTATSNDVVATNTTQVITFSEAISPATLVCTDITTNSTETCTGIVLSAGNTVATVTYSDALEAGDILTLAANSVTDVAGNPGPAIALTETV